MAFNVYREYWQLPVNRYVLPQAAHFAPGNGVAGEAGGVHVLICSCMRSSCALNPLFEGGEGYGIYTLGSAGSIIYVVDVSVSLLSRCRISARWAGGVAAPIISCVAAVCLTLTSINLRMPTLK